ncbi:hypothetical protein CG51_05845 [Haematobacter missouriensis]|uniref:Phage gp6-like head-tail connector protein n=1 Tax=Haematobacter missouriensis TaxID=366616 RepID=A0A212AQQ5_9RHOB|nr:head-tail connector protein [Haematobacter missouriensis]KFI30965.1 hypothetical protein CG51_05845 [Haematobacter missouriensis]OWJ73886.1 phage gp6-like head-tail connector protein [Haematobacter missouriensis]OWJ83818.1 phage gp6-like head-tail connector protein [Haematobacter missouriensis]
MADLVTVDEAKALLQILHNEDDASIGLLVSAVSDRLLEYVKATETPDPIPPEMKVAAIFWVGLLYKTPDSDPDGLMPDNYPPAAVRAMIYPRRTPTLA